MMMRSFRFPVFGTLIAVLVFGAAYIVGQTQGRPAAAPKYGRMHLWAAIGSFALLNGEGSLEMKFKGTLLISNLDGTSAVSGKVRKEFDGMGRTVWFGEGVAKVSGKWRKIQWFGEDVDCVWEGRGLARVYGEYDERTKSTGRVKVDDLPEEPWMTNGREFYVPKELAPGWGLEKDNKAPNGN
ncbi:MAG: hypothetical protein QW652_05085 [Candidatus Nitrosotenuis sp.]